jgi:hypothetical protein
VLLVIADCRLPIADYQFVMIHSFGVNSIWKRKMRAFSQKARTTEPSQRSITESGALATALAVGKVQAWSHDQLARNFFAASRFVSGRRAMRLNECGR